MTLRTCVAVVCLVAGALIARPAAAQKADATAAFQRGQQLKRDGKTAEACAAFALSMKLDAQYGTQYNLALCYLALGRTASAWAELDELSSKDPNAARRADAAKRAQELRARLTRVWVKLAQPVASLQVSRDDIDITALIGAPAPVDPGKHRFVARAPGRRDWSAEIDVAGEGKTVDVVVPALPPIAMQAAEPVAAPIAPSVVREDVAPSSPGRTRRIAGVAAFSVGVVGLAVGGVYGFRALSKGDDARHECGGEIAQCTGDTTAAQHLIDDGRSAATISNAALIAGGVLAAAGVVLYVTAPRGVTAAPLVDSSAIGAMVSARF
jgi:hypothetical protein